MSKLSINVNGLKKNFGTIKAIDGITFKVKSGSVFGMLGPNGAGKTTTIETLVGLYERDGGEVKVLGLDPERDLQKLKSRIGVQLQSPSLFPRLTVKEILKLFASFYPNPLGVNDVISRVGLEKKQKERVKTLSGGQRHRLAVGLAMISNGELVFLDEPTTGLDPQARRQLWEVVLGLKENGVTVFLTTHYMEEAEKLCDQLVIIDQGKVIANDSPSNLIETYFKEKAVEFNNPGFTESEKQKLGQFSFTSKITYEEKNGEIIMYTENISRAISELMSFSDEINKDIEDFVVRQPTLDDVFLKLTGKGIGENEHI
ncbi:MAG: ATP-binding cassette domain-containing protein [Bacillota bacterium]